MDRSNFARALRHNHQDVENYNYSWYAYHLSPVTSNVNFQEGLQEGFQVDVPRWFSLIFNLLSFIKLSNDQGCKYLLVTVHVSRAFLIQYNFVTLDTRSSKVERFLSVKKKREKKRNFNGFSTSGRDKNVLLRYSLTSRSSPFISTHLATEYHNMIEIEL